MSTTLESNAMGWAPFLQQLHLQESDVLNGLGKQKYLEILKNASQSSRKSRKSQKLLFYVSLPLP